MRVVALHTRFYERFGVNLILVLHPHAIALRVEKHGEIASKFGKRFRKTVDGSNAALELFTALRNFDSNTLYQLTLKVNGDKNGQ